MRFPARIIHVVGHALAASLVDPLLEIVTRHPPLAAKFHRGERPCAKQGGDNKRRNVHVLANVCNRQPRFVEVDVNPIHEHSVGYVTCRYQTSEKSLTQQG